MNRRPLRMQHVNDVFICSNRTLQNQPLLPTDPLSNGLMLGKLGLLAAAYEVELYAYSFLPNGFWLLLADPTANKANFMRDFQSWLALRQNDALDREGKFFHGRYDDEAIGDAQMLVDTYVDILVAPVREGAAKSLDDYDGATSWRWLKSGVAPIGKWLDRDKLRSLRRSNPELSEDVVAREFPIELVYPQIDGPEGELEEEKEIASWLQEKVAERVEQILAWQAQVGHQAVIEMSMTPHEAPWEASKVEPLGPPKYRYSWTCRTYSNKRLARHRRVRRRKRNRYDEAMGLWRKASPFIERSKAEARGARASIESLALAFPTGTFPPGWVRMRKPLDLHLENAPPGAHPGAA